MRSQKIQYPNYLTQEKNNVNYVLRVHVTITDIASWLNPKCNYKLNCAELFHFIFIIQVEN